MDPKALRLRQQLHTALSTKDPYQIAAALELPSLVHSASSSSSSSSLENSQKKYSNITLQDSSGVEWGGVLTSLIQATDAAIVGDAVRCYEAQSSLHAALNHIFGSSSGNILVPALHITCRNTHKMAILADLARVKKGERNDHSKLQSAVTTLQESFSKTLNDRKEWIPTAPLSEDGSKKAGVLYIVNQLFSMYFRLNTLRLCKNLLKPVESRKLHEQGSIGERVTYKYYVGRLSLLEDQYEVAEENLDYAFLHCHKKAVSNKRRILHYLIPVKLLRGRLPTDLLLDKYNVQEFKSLVHGLRTGNLKMFNAALDKYQNRFIYVGTYLLLEKCKAICYRNLFKRVFLVTNKTQLPLQYIAQTFKWLHIDMDMDEIECILANLIFRGFVRGYIYHEKRILVLSKKDPFPISALSAR